MGDRKPDFTGWASVNDQKCTDGRTIKSGAFAHMDKKTVPLIWQHQHNDSSAVLGHAYLEHKAFGVFCHGYFNDTDAGVNAKLMVQHGDVSSLSIFANNLNERRSGQGNEKDVYHGDIREVSLVLVGANPGAVIDFVNMVHGDSFIELDSEAYIYNDQTLVHSGLTVTPDEDTVSKPVAKKSKKTKTKEVVSEMSHQEILDSLTEEQGEVVHGLLNSALTHADLDTDLDVDKVLDSLTDEQGQLVHSMLEAALEHSDNLSEGDNNMSTLEHADGEKTVKDVFDSLTEEQKNVVYYMIGEAVNEAEGKPAMAQSALTDEDRDGFLAHIDNTFEKGFETMKHNLFEQNGAVASNTAIAPTLSHDQLSTILTEAQKEGSLKEAFLAHAAEYGFEDIDVLFPDAQTISSNPELIKRRTEWVATVLEQTNHSPFSRIKSIFADITGEQARARGYVKGNLKKDEVVKLLKRVTTPTTVYKKQKLDRDDMLDITSLDVVAWLKAEMRLMLDEEIARAILIGDGRNVDDPDKIDEDHLRPIAYDSELFTHTINIASNTSPNDIVEAVLRGRREYKGTGNPVFFTTDEVLTDLILQKDKIGRRLYDTEESLAAALRVSRIVTVEVMVDAPELVGVIVNLQDYTIGADQGGRLGMFDDFDIDYNQYKYLIETRISGTLTKPKSALVIKKELGTSVTPTQPTYDPATHVITIPTKAGVEYYIDDTKVNSGAQPAITKSTTVEARPADGYSFPHGTDTDWYFAY